MQNCQEFLREMEFLVVNYAGRHALMAGTQVKSRHFRDLKCFSYHLHT